MLVFGEGCVGPYHRPEGESVRDVAVVICPPLGYEAICSHRALRELAQRLAEEGIAALRLDYHGTGDSLGHDRLPQRVDAWLASIDAAIVAVRRESHVRDVVLVGLRLGANLAAAAAARRGDLSGVVLFAPCASGKSFVRETRVLRLLAAAHEGMTAAAESDELDAAGFILTNETIAELTRSLAWPEARLAPRLLVLERDDGAVDSKVRAALESSGSNVEFATVLGYSAMMVDPHCTTVPRAVNARIATWLASGHPKIASSELASRRTAEHGSAPAVLEGDGFTERALWLGARSSIFAIVTTPIDEAARRGTVVLLNPGSVHHIGSNRMHVNWARAWAKAGFVVARIDVGGIGESPPASGQPENQTYSTSAVPDVEAVMAELARNSPSSPVVLIGMCSGAYAAFHSALSATKRSSNKAPNRPSGVVLINPQTFHFHPGDPLEVNPLTATRHYKKSLSDPSKWKRLFTGQVDIARGANALYRIAVRKLKNEIGRRIEGHDVGRELATIASRIDTLLVYSASDPGLDYLAVQAPKALHKLRTVPKFRMSLIDDADHTFTLIDAQRRLETMLTEHLERVAPRSTTKPSQ